MRNVAYSRFQAPSAGDQAESEFNLFTSARKVVGKDGAAGVDRQSSEEFAEHEIDEIRRLHRQLHEETYRPRPVRRVWIPKPGSAQQRPLGIPTVRDRVVQTAILNVIEPIFDNKFHERSFGFHHCNWNVFDAYDRMICRRLRRQLLKRHRRNPTRLSRTLRWPNAYFTALGFRSLRNATTGYVQSLDLGDH